MDEFYVYEKANTIRESVDRIKQTLRWFPGLVLGIARQIGKTTALLEVVHDDHRGAATIYCMNHPMALYAKQMYRDKYPDEPLPNFVSQTDKVRGRSDPIFADEWWNIPAEDRRNLIGTGRLLARVGTESSQRTLDSTVIRFTDEELDCLEALFNALINDPDSCEVFEIPGTVKIHRDLLRKFKSEKDLE